MKRNSVELKPAVFECPNCGSMRVETRSVRDRFQYGSGTKSVELEALVPLRKCADCEFEFTDSETEDLRQEAVCEHLGVMTPAQITALRKKYDLTRADLAEITRIGEASLARWETGELIQNPANDQYLFLLSFPENLHRLESRRLVVARTASRTGRLLEFRPRFKTLDETATTAMRQKGQGFLRQVG